MISYYLPMECHVKLNIYDILGRQIFCVTDRWETAGENSFRWDASDLTAGLYFYELVTPFYSETKKMMVIK